MSQRFALLLAAALTTFVLLLVGGLVTRLSQAESTAQAEIPTEVAAAAPTDVPALDPAVEAAVREREAAYQAALAEANTRLEQANAQIAEANRQVARAAADEQKLQEQLLQSQPAAPAPVAVAPAPAVAVAPAPPVVAAPTYAVSPEQALAIALGAAPGAAATQAPELVSYEQTVAYEVKLDRGLVYVDAQSGAVLANRAAQAGPVSQEQAARAALDYFGGGEVTSVELRDVGGAQVYVVTLSDSRIVYVDPATGAVVYAEIQQTGGRGGDDDEGEHEGEDEHEGEHDD